MVPSNNSRKLQQIFLEFEHASYPITGRVFAVSLAHALGEQRLMKDMPSKNPSAKDPLCEIRSAAGPSHPAPHLVYRLRTLRSSGHDILDHLE